MTLRARTKAASPAGGGRSDRVAFSAMLALIAIGLMLAFAASPAGDRQRLHRGRFPLCREADCLCRCCLRHPRFRVCHVAKGDQAVRGRHLCAAL